MIAYSTVGANDLARSKVFYDPVIAALGGAVVDAYTDETTCGTAASAQVFWC